MNYIVSDIKVTYKVFKQDVCGRLDKGIEKLANEQGLTLCGSGFDFRTQERDLHFIATAIENLEKD